MTECVYRYLSKLDAVSKMTPDWIINICMCKLGENASLNSGVKE